MAAPSAVVSTMLGHSDSSKGREGGRKEGREGGREGWRKGERKREKGGEREGRRERGREGGREGREEGREGERGKQHVQQTFGSHTHLLEYPVDLLVAVGASGSLSSLHRPSVKEETILNPDSWPPTTVDTWWTHKHYLLDHINSRLCIPLLTENIQPLA